MKRYAVLPLTALAFAVACSDSSKGLLEPVAPGSPNFDNIGLVASTSVDAVSKIMALQVGGGPKTTTLYVTKTSDDNKPGCNLTGSTTLVVSVVSSNSSVATVSPSSVTFGSCGEQKTLTVTPVGGGSATISLAQTSNNTGGTFDLSPARFTADVASAAITNTPPSIEITGVAGGASYEIGSVPAAVCSVTDAEDGNSTFAATISGTLTYGLGSQTASCSYTDAGSLTAASSVTYSIVDTTDPVITFVSRTPAANDAGWNNSDVTVNWTCTDSGSGVVDASVSKTVSTEGEDQSATGTCTDNAGNPVSNTQSGINIDKTAPSLNPSVSPNPVLLNGSATASAGASDALSGLESQSCDAVDASSVGSGKTVSCRATDNAGNTASGSATYSVGYDFVGFAKPVENNGVLNVGKAGQAIPLKWRLLDANGQPVTSLSSVNVSVQSLACAVATTTDNVEEYASGSSGLQNLGDGYYQFNWKTPTTYAYSCKTMKLNLGEGTNSTRNALFKFTK